MAEATSWRQISIRRVEEGVVGVSEGRGVGGGLVECGEGDVGAAGESGILVDRGEAVGRVGVSLFVLIVDEAGLMGDSGVYMSTATGWSCENRS